MTGRLPKSWFALQALLIYLMGQEEYNKAVDNGMTIDEDFRHYNPNITDKLQAGITALVEDDNAVIGSRTPLPQALFLIRNKYKPELWWSNEDGWGFCSTATWFTTEERWSFDAPIDGLWVLEDELRKEIDRLHDEVDLWIDAAKTCQHQENVEGN